MNDDLRNSPATDPASPEPGGFSPDPGPAKTPVPPLTWGELKFVPLGLLALFGFPIPWTWMPFSFFSEGIIFFLSISFWYISLGILYSRAHATRFEDLLYLFKAPKLLVAVIALAALFIPLCILSYVAYKMAGLFDIVDDFFDYILWNPILESIFLLILFIIFRKFKIINTNISLIFAIIGLSSSIYFLAYIIFGFIYFYD